MEKLMACFNYVKLFKNLKELVFGKHVVADRIFKFATKYTVCTLMLLMVLTFRTGVNCRGNVQENLNRNDYCLNAGTFLVTKALRTDAGRTLQYPGIAPYIKGKDEVQKQENYKLINSIYGILITISCVPFFLWKVETVRKIEVILKRRSTEEMVKHYCMGKYRSGDVSFFYICTKIMAIFVPIVQWFVLCLFFGKQFQMYGADIIQTYFYNTWPNPADVLFPKHAMCEIAQYTPSGHLQTVSFVCDIEANHFLRWSMCLFWFWMLVMLVIGIIHLMYVGCLYWKSDGFEFGDWIVLRFLRCNLNAYDFTQFMVLYAERQEMDFFVGGDSNGV